MDLGVYYTYTVLIIKTQGDSTITTNPYIVRFSTEVGSEVG